MSPIRGCRIASGGQRCPPVAETVNTMEVGRMPEERRMNQSKRLTAAGLIAVTAATLLMMAWVIFPTPAFASTQQTTWNHINGAQFVPCSGTTLWILSGSGNNATHVSNVSISVNGGPAVPMPPQGNVFKADVPGPATNAQNTTAVVTWTWDDSGTVPTPILTISHCEGATTPPPPEKGRIGVKKETVPCGDRAA